MTAGRDTQPLAEALAAAQSAKPHRDAVLRSVRSWQRASDTDLALFANAAEAWLVEWLGGQQEAIAQAIAGEGGNIAAWWAHPADEPHAARDECRRRAARVVGVLTTSIREDT